jgi:predicted component of type VI protein secretion system
MTLSELLSRLEQDIVALKDKISHADYSLLEERYVRMKESILTTSKSLSERLKQQLDEHQASETLNEAKQKILDSLQEFSQVMAKVNEDYKITNTIEVSLKQLQDTIVDFVDEFKENYGQQIQSSVEALSYGFKAWVDAKPLEQDFQTLKSAIETQIQSFKAWIGKE